MLVNITGGLDMTLLEVDEAANAIAGEVDGDANIIFGAAFDPSLDGKIRGSVVATGMDEAVMSRIEPQGTNLLDGRRNAAPATPAAPVRAPEPARAESVRAEFPRVAEPAPVTPTFQSSERTYAATPRVDVRPEPVIRVAEERDLQPIVDPWVEEYEAAPQSRTAAAAPEAQGDLYSERPAAAAPAREEVVADDSYDDRDHRRSGWSLFGRGKRTPTPPVYVPSSSRGTSQMRTTTSAQPAPEPEMGQAEDDLEIPSFLRRLAN